VAANCLAGLTELSFREFALYDVLGNILNVGLMLFIGLTLGAYWDQIEDGLSLASVVLTIIHLFWHPG